MANVVNTFTLKLEKGDFQTQIKEAQKSAENSSIAIARALKKSSEAQVEFNKELAKSKQLSSTLKTLETDTQKPQQQQ